MKYGADYFENFFEQKDNWCEGFLEDDGNKCALGHMKFKYEIDADKNARAKSLAKMIVWYIEKTYGKMSECDKEPSYIIPAVNDGHAIKAGGKYINTKKEFGSDAKTRIMTVIKRAKALCEMEN